MDFSQVLRARHSTRLFTNEPVDTKTLESIVQDATHTASWANSHPWRVYLATGETMRKIRSLHEEKVRRGDPENSVLPPLHRGDLPAEKTANMRDWGMQYRTSVTASGSDLGTLNDRLFNAPAAAYLAVPSGVQPWTLLDLGAFSSTLMLAAADRGIGSMIAYEFVKYPDELTRLLRVKDGYSIVIGIGLGHEDPHAPANSFRSSRQNLEDILTVRD